MQILRQRCCVSYLQYTSLSLHIILAETRFCWFYFTVNRQDKPSAADLKLALTNCMMIPVWVSHLFPLWRKYGGNLGFSGREWNPKADPFWSLCSYSTYYKNSQPLPGPLVLWWYKYRGLPGILYVISISDTQLFWLYKEISKILVCKICK